MKLKPLITLLLSILSAITLLLAAVPLYEASAMPLTRPMLFYNDNTWVLETRSPLKEIDGVQYVPLTLFAQLKDSKVRINEQLNTFVISSGELYISIDATTSIATDQFDKYYVIQTYKLDYGERYVPAKEICRHVGLGYDTYTSKITGETAVRITDSTEKLSFKELLQVHNPDLLKLPEDTTLESESNSNKNDTSETTSIPPQKILGSRTLYFTVSGDVGKHTDEILNMFQDASAQATFFISQSDIENYPLIISRIVAENHKIGIKLNDNSNSDINTLITQYDTINENLYRMFKFKTRTVRVENRSKDDILKLIESGYKNWEATRRALNGLYSTSYVSERYINSIWDNNTLVIDFNNNNSAPNVISNVLSFVNENSNKCDIRLCDDAFKPLK